MRGEVLFLSHRIPFPPDRGDKIRSHHILRHIAALAPVHVACFADDARDLAAEGELAALAASHCLIERSKPLVLAGLESLVQHAPVSFPAFASAQLHNYVAQTLRERPISAIYVFSGQMGQYVPDDFRGRVVFDFVDVDSAKFEAYAASGKGWRRWIDAREGRLLGTEEARLARRADVSLLVSDEEAALFRARLPLADQGSCDVRALRNGIDAVSFDPALVRPEPRLLACSAPRLIFTGQMDYAPNIAAAGRVIDRLLPAIRERVPGATFHVVGRNPPPDLLARHGQDGAHVWGAVDDIRTWLGGADLALVPLDLARGVQNKVLEAMAMRLPVVLTSGAATGIGARDGLHYAIADSDAALVDRVAALLASPHTVSAMGREARRFVLDRLSWEATLAPLGALLAPAPGQRDAA